MGSGISRRQGNPEELATDEYGWETEQGEDGGEFGVVSHRCTQMHTDGNEIRG
jgi:hypothetical protein